jgi:hypothetical protein
MAVTTPVTSPAAMMVVLVLLRVMAELEVEDVLIGVEKAREE